MGVHGVTTFLKRQGLLPPPNTVCCRESLWRIDESVPSSSSSPSSPGNDVRKASDLFSVGGSGSSSVGASKQETSASHSLHRLKPIPPGSTFLVDGNGLAFHLHSVAYARHARAVLDNRSEDSNCPTIQSLTRKSERVAAVQEKLTRLLPMMLPLSLLRQVTVEFVSTVRQQGLTIDIYWDGPERRFKELTESKRKDRRTNEWGAVEQYCMHGTMPVSSTDTVCECEYRFPYSKLFTMEIRHTLQNMTWDDQGVKMVNCVEEADVELARKASGLKTHYILGQDSDFVFYRDVQYVPIESLALLRPKSSPVSGKMDDAKPSNRGFFGSIMSALNSPSTPAKHTAATDALHGVSLMGYVLTRKEVAHVFDVPDSLMAELAILLGNDYVDPTTTSMKKSMAHTVEDVVEYLQEQAGVIDYDSEAEERAFDYRVKSEPINAQVERAMDFVRSLYDLKPMDDFPIEDDSDSDRDDEDGEDNLFDKETEDLLHILEGRLYDISSSFSRSNVVMRSTDKSIIDIILRALSSAVDQTDVDPFLTQMHIDAYIMSISQNKSSSNSSYQNGGWEKWNVLKLGTGQTADHQPPLRPEWNDILAGYAIEVCVLLTYRYYSKSLLVRSTPPDNLVSQYMFHSILAHKRAMEKPTPSPSSAILIPKADNKAASSSAPAPVRVTLPIDEYEDDILDSIEMNRVTIIHGETGCGKSSRLPIMLLRAPSPDIMVPEVKMYISQPRRIAAKALVERVRSCEPEFKDAFALRMGHGWKEYESNQTRCWFVTTGYLTRVLANNPNRFNNISHLVIDEVHERSVDTDILCLLCRRLLDSNKHIRLVLMSATLATSLYTEYFKVPNPAIHVGVRRFPITEYFIEDVMHLGLLPKEAKAAASIITECDTQKCRSAPNSTTMVHRSVLAARLATIVGKPGSSVLIFVPGMAEILATMELIEEFCIVGVRFTCFPIHSDIPFEDQMSAFDSPAEDEVKVIIATNAAESSVTLPDVDVVICFGLCRQIVYNEKSHRQMLTSAWISRASATQRAGRTGRVRPGAVYRLYTRIAFSNYMEEFEPGEMVRIPLDSVILMLKEMLNEKITPVLLDCIEPPEMKTIDKSFESLEKWGFLTNPNDEGEITTLGKFVSSLGVDLMLGALIGLGIQFGVAAEAIEMAAVMSFPQSPFRRTSPAQTPFEVNQVLSSTYVARSHFDANLKSDTLMLMNFLWDYEISSNKPAFSYQFSTALSRVRQLAAVKDNLRKRVATFLGINEARLMMEAPPVHMHSSKVALLRILQVWVFSEMLITCPPSPKLVSSDGSVALTFQCHQRDLCEKHFEEVLNQKRHPFALGATSNIQKNGSFTQEVPFDLEDFAVLFEPRTVSYCLEQGISAFWYFDQNQLRIFMEYGTAQAVDLALIFQGMTSIAIDGDFAFYEKRTDKKRRGIDERKCGSWTPCEGPADGELKSSNREVKKLVRLVVIGINRVSATKILGDKLLAFEEVKSIANWRFTPAKTKQKGSEYVVNFFIKLLGEVSNIPDVDLKDMLGGYIDIKPTQENVVGSQRIVFSPTDSTPEDFNDPKKKHMATPFVTPESSWKRPIFNDIPEGARLFLLVASNNRREKFPSLRLAPLDENMNRITNIDSANGIDSITVIVKSEVKPNFRWKRLDSGQPVFVPDVAVPSTAVHSSRTLFCCSSNSLELKGGRAKVEGLTLLPPNSLFVLLSFLSFGLVPGNMPPDEKDLDSAFADLTINYTMQYTTAVESEAAKKSRKLDSSLKWLELYQKKSNTSDGGVGGDGNDEEFDQEDAAKRIVLAGQFHESCADLGETLCCFTDKVAELCKLFDGIDGEPFLPWESLESKSLTEANLRKWRHEYQISRNISTNESGPAPGKNRTPSDTAEMKAPPANRKEDTGTGSTLEKKKNPSYNFKETNGTGHVSGKKNRKRSTGHDNKSAPAAALAPAPEFKPAPIPKENKWHKKTVLEAEYSQTPKVPPTQRLISSDGETEQPTLKSMAISTAKPSQKKGKAKKNQKKPPPCDPKVFSLPSQWAAVEIGNEIVENAQSDATQPAMPSSQLKGEKKKKWKDKKLAAKKWYSGYQQSEAGDKSAAASASTNSSRVEERFPGNGNSQQKAKETKEYGKINKKEQFSWKQNPMKITPALTTDYTKLFATELPANEEVSTHELVSTNILALLFVAFDAILIQRGRCDDNGVSFTNDRKTVTLDRRNWSIIQVADPKGNSWYSARFTNDLIPERSFNTKKLPEWFPNQRPSQANHMQSCMPPGTRVPNAIAVPVKEKPAVLFFEDLATALKMESVFWLDRQFCKVSSKDKLRRWFRITLPEMMTELRRRAQTFYPDLDE